MAHPSALLTAPIGPTLVRLAVPNIVAMFAALVSLVAEAWYVGQLGTASLAGLAFAFPMMMLMLMLSAGSIGGAITGAVAQRLGAGDRSGAEVLALHALVLAVMMAALSALVFLNAGSAIYGALGGTGVVLEQALAYSDVLFSGCLAMWVANGLAGIVRATGHMKVAAKSLTTGYLVQIIAAAVLIFGIGPLPKMGIAGAAAGIVIGYAVAALLLLYFLTRNCPELRLRLWGIPLKFTPMANILKVGILASVNSFCSVATIIALTAFMARFGVDILAGYGIGARLEFLIIPLIFGFGSASTAMVGVHFGAQEINRAHRVGWTAAFYSAGMAGLIGGSAAVFPGIWANIFTDVEAVRAACRTYLQIVGPFYAFFGMALALYFASQGAGRVLWPVLGSVLRLAIVLVGSIVLAGTEESGIGQYFMLIAAAMAAQGILTATAVRLGAWTRGLDQAKTVPVVSEIS